MNYSIKPKFDENVLIAFTLGTIAPGSALNGLVYDAVYGVTGAPTAVAGVYIPGATIRNAVSGVVYRNSGSTASPAFTAM